MHGPEPIDSARTPAERKTWTAPLIEELPKLTDLTLFSGGSAPPPFGNPVGGGGSIIGGNGSTVF